MTEPNQEPIRSHEPRQPAHGHENHQSAQRPQGSQPQRHQLPPRDPNGEYRRLSTKPSFVTQSQSREIVLIPRTPSATTNIRQQQRDPNDRTVYIGKKLAMSYVLAVVTRFNNGDSEVKVKARGRNISVAADVTQIVKNRFIPTLKIKNVDITTEELTSDDGRVSKVSSMQITMTK